MAKVAKNLILHGASGKIGDQIVIRQRGGKVILSQAPEYPLRKGLEKTYAWVEKQVKKLRGSCA